MLILKELGISDIGTRSAYKKVSGGKLKMMPEPSQNCADSQGFAESVQEFVGSEKNQLKEENKMKIYDIGIYWRGNPSRPVRIVGITATSADRAAEIANHQIDASHGNYFAEVELDQYFGDNDNEEEMA